MGNQEEKLKTEIRELFCELNEEVKDRFDIATNRKIIPNNIHYVKIAEELYQKAIELENLNKNISAYDLKDVMREEVDEVFKHKFEYKGNIPKGESITELQNKMRDATMHIQMYYSDVLGNIKIE
jgi:hypothetical protein